MKRAMKRERDEERSGCGDVKAKGVVADGTWRAASY